MYSEIMTTKNYDIFNLHSVNRNVKRQKIESLKKSMREHGYIPAYPLHVIKGDSGMYEIKGGHHRFTAASELGIEVFFVVCDDNASIHDLEKCSSAWSVSDYATSYYRQGLPDYIELFRFCDEYDVPLSAAASMLFGQLASSGNAGPALKSGRFRVKDKKHAATVGGLVQVLKAKKVEFYNHTALVQTLSRFVATPECDVLRLEKKLKSYHSLLARCTNVKDFAKTLEDVYNYKDTNKVPLAFFSDEAARKRNALAHNPTKKESAPMEESREPKSCAPLHMAKIGR